MTHTVELLQDSDVCVAPPSTATAAWTQQVRSRAHVLVARIAASLNAHAVSVGEAALYEQLSKLTDADLARRGLSRGDLHRLVVGI